MRRSAGFTLIELVIVIVILGILGAVAAPKLFNLQGDAYGANLSAMKSSISTGMTIANAKAQIKGTLNADGTTADVVDPSSETTPGKGSVSGYDFIEFKYGYPSALANEDPKADSPAGILGTLENFDKARYDLDTTTTSGSLIISPKSITTGNCHVTYKEATADDSAKVTSVITGC